MYNNNILYYNNVLLTSGLLKVQLYECGISFVYAPELLHLTTSVSFNLRQLGHSLCQSATVAFGPGRTRTRVTRPLAHVCTDVDRCGQT